MTLKQTVREQAVPFRSCDPFFSAANISHLEKITAEIDAGKASLKEHKLMEG